MTARCAIPFLLSRVVPALIILAASFLSFADTERIRVGVLQYGTVNWEMDVMKRHAIDQRLGVSVDAVPLASNQALLTALQSQAVDVIVGDWIWAARQRELGRPYSFFPYSTLAAQLIVPSGSSIKSFDDLRGKRIGVAGGSVNKSWVLYRSYGIAVHQLDLQADSQVKFGAPPLLNALIKRGDLDAVINFWHYSRYLMDDGMQVLLDSETVLQKMGIRDEVPLLGWLFHRPWAQKNVSLIESFLQASYQTRELMKQNDDEWPLIEPLKKIDKVSLLHQLRDGYREGIPTQFGNQEMLATIALYDVLRDYGDRQLRMTGALQPGELFWKSPVLPH